MSPISETREYRAIAQYYEGKLAKRSGVPYMNHINEGLDVLEQYTLERGQCTRRAQLIFCLHPLVQANTSIDVSWSSAYDGALEYRDKANLYLCRPETDYIDHPTQLVPIMQSMSVSCARALIADKVQNRNDFMKYHVTTHPRARQFLHYYQIWIDYLSFFARLTNDPTH